MSDLEKFASSSMRGRKRGIYQQLLGSLLIKANRTDDPLIKISCICEAAYMSRNKKVLDMNLIECCFTVCKSLQNVRTINKKNWSYIRVTFPFIPNEENWKKYIAPWQKISLRYYPLITSWRHLKYPTEDRLVHVSPYHQLDHYNKVAEFNDKLSEKVVNEIGELPKDFQFYQKCSALSIKSFKELKEEFWLWAVQKLMELQAVLSDEIDPKVYGDIGGQTKEDEEEDQKQ